MKWFIGRYNTGIQVQNVSTNNTATDITITYEGGCTETRTGIAANGVVMFVTSSNTCLEDGWRGSAVVTSSGEPIVGVVNQNDDAEGVTGDSALSFDMFPTGP
jgi:hypothetical protein